jgi:phenylacetate-CoA ligase
MKRALSRKNLWEHAPPWLKSTLGAGLGWAPPAWWLGRSFRKNCAFLQDAQRWPAEHARLYQWEKLQGILRLAYEKAPFYRRAFDALGVRPEDIRTREDMGRLPLIDKRIVGANLSDMCTKSIREGGIDFGSTGGVSGSPLHFYLDAQRSSIEYAYLTTSWQRVGYRPSMPMAVLRGRVVRADRMGFHHEYDPILRHHYYSSFHMSDLNMRHYLEHMATIGPCFLHVYPSSVAALARFCHHARLLPPANIQGIIAESEIVYPEQRKMVEEVFGCRYFSSYGHSEKLVLAAECEHCTDYHVWPTYGYFELLGDNGDLVTTPGQRGEIVGTGFINTVMPFIRYRTGDWATYVGDRCDACGREHILLRDIRGHRTQEVLIAADGSEISWTALNMHDDTFAHVRQFQFLQETPGRAVLRVVPAPGFGEADAGRIQRQLGRKLEDRITFTIELIEAIPLSARGKAIYVDQRIPEKRRASGYSTGPMDPPDTLGPQVPSSA